MFYLIKSKSIYVDSDYNFACQFKIVFSPSSHIFNLALNRDEKPGDEDGKHKQLKKHVNHGMRAISY